MQGVLGLQLCHKPASVIVAVADASLSLAVGHPHSDFIVAKDLLSSESVRNSKSLPSESPCERPTLLCHVM